jgi:phosphohistidine phosphatase
MKLLVVRHAVALEREEFAATGKPDDLRPLTDRGRRKMRRAARGLRRLVPHLDVLATSPLTRAAQTADLLSEAFHGIQVTPVDELAPDTPPDALVPWLRTLKPSDVAAVVGHEPHLGFLLGWLLTGRHASFIELRKGGACLLEFEDPPAAGGATLLWALPPKQLRGLR